VGVGWLVGCGGGGEGKGGCNKVYIFMKTVHEVHSRLPKVSGNTGTNTQRLHKAATTYRHRHRNTDKQTHRERGTRTCTCKMCKHIA
jgi:hypothetical protein